MEGKVTDPAAVIRKLIDYGPIEGLECPEGAHQKNAEHSKWPWRTEGSPKVSFADPLGAPWDACRSVLLSAGRSRRERITALYDLLWDLPNREEVIWRVNQADLTTEPPFPQTAYPEVFEEDVAVYDLHQWGEKAAGLKQVEAGNPPSPTASSAGPLSPKGEELEVPLHKPNNGEKEGGKAMTVSSLDSRRQTRVKAFEAFRPRPPTDWLVEGVISPSSLNLLVGEGGTKKTYSMLDLAVCLAMGKPWLGFETRQTPVLWVDEESGPDRMNQRLAQALRAHQAEPDIPLEYLSVCQFNLRQPDDLNLFFRHVFEMEAGLVVVDALADVMPGADENLVRDVVPVFRGLRGVATATGAAVMVIHHANKSGGYRGSSHMRGAVELMLMAQSKPDSSFIEFQSVKTRDTGSIHFAAQIHFDPPEGDAARVWLSPIGTEEASRVNRKGEALSTAEKYVMGYLMENGDCTIKEVMENAEGCTPAGARQGLYEMVKIGMVERTNEGGKGVTAIYGLTWEGEVT